MNCAAVIPCLNEAAAIAPLVRQVREFIPDVVVVDDGSTDETSILARSAGARLLRHDQARGKGAALATGLRTLADDGYQWALTMDGDGQHAPEDIPSFFTKALTGDFDLIIGNRMRDPRAMPFVRRQVNRWMSRRISDLAGQPCPDSQCGFRLFRLNLWEELSIDASHFEIESDFLLQFARAGHHIAFVPIQVVYKNERSKIRPLRDTLRWLRWYKNARAASNMKRAPVRV